MSEYGDAIKAKVEKIVSKRKTTEPSIQIKPSNAVEPDISGKTELSDTDITTKLESKSKFTDNQLSNMNKTQLYHTLRTLAMNADTNVSNDTDILDTVIAMKDSENIAGMKDLVKELQGDVSNDNVLRGEGDGGRIEKSEFDQNDSIDYDSSTISPEDELLKYAKVDQRKFSEYIFKEGSAPGKEVVFNKLGYTKKQSILLSEIYKEQGNAKYQSGAYRLGKLDRFGQRITIVIELYGIGENANQVVHVISGWMIRPDGTITLNTPFAGFEK